MTSPSPELRGRSCLVTGATSGIGRAAAEALARRGAELLLVARDADRGEHAASEIRRDTGNDAVRVLHADLASQGSVRKLAREVVESGAPLHVLLNNAGVFQLRREETEDGIETTFAVNHLAPFLLTNLLLDRLRESAPARVVTVASDAYAWARGGLDWDDLEGRRRFSARKAYGTSKLANILFTRELARRLEGSGVTANCLHPGFVGTNLGRHNGLLGRLLVPLIRPLGRSPEKGAETAVYLAASPEAAEVSGEYFFDRQVRRTRREARSDDDAQRLWALSERMTGLSA